MFHIVALAAIEMADIPSPSKPLPDMPTPPWLQCELCDRKASVTDPRLRAAFNNSEDTAAVQGVLVLLCMDCWAFVRGDIGEGAWRERVSMARHRVG